MPCESRPLRSSPFPSNAQPWITGYPTAPQKGLYIILCAVAVQHGIWIMSKGLNFVSHQEFTLFKSIYVQFLPPSLASLRYFLRFVVIKFAIGILSLSRLS
ncbi:uncharacterized protein K441DRAFT_809 [Cenococcum geophilum 1.58]|uniref:uncharacterized protein n=1 Tax=Cenococcum geophilum 1.58 TaxID=794803 RepID=UPI00358E8D28|nr:hypothetical protein K441DRAFT_809 [Cenococcum geophilum 1.58]